VCTHGLLRLRLTKATSTRSAGLRERKQQQQFFLCERNQRQSGLRERKQQQQSFLCERNQRQSGLCERNQQAESAGLRERN
jgi:hypothetical protein